MIYSQLYYCSDHPSPGDHPSQRPELRKALGTFNVQVLDGRLRHTPSGKTSPAIGCSGGARFPTRRRSGQSIRTRRTAPRL